MSSSGSLTGQETIQIGDAFSYVTNSPGWMGNCAKAGLFLLIPIAGILSLLSWERRIFEAYQRRDREIPAYTFDPGYGISVLVASLNIVPLIFVLYMVIAVIGAIVVFLGAGIESATNNSGAGGVIALVGMLGLYAALFVVIIFINLVMPELRRRGHKGEMGPLFSPGRSIAAVRSAPGQYGMLFLGTIIAGMAGGIGVIACYIGMLLTLPFSMAVSSVLYAQWDEVVRGRLGEGA